MIDTHETDRPAARRTRPHPVDILWLSFLALYLTPWITSAPPARNWQASAIGTFTFFAIYIHSYRCSPRRLLPHIVATALIGFALAWFGGVWNVFHVLAASIAARLEPRPAAIAVIAMLQLTLMGFCLWLRLPPVAWVSGVYFGILAAGTTMLLVDLDRRNRDLHAAQAAVRRLTVAAERERIARDLHDLLGRSLTAIALKANLARRLARRDAVRAEAEMTEVEQAAREALVEVRAAVTGIGGRSLADEVEHARAMLDAAGLVASIDAGAVPDDHRHEDALAMVLREAVTNVVRHADATSCTIAYGPADNGRYRLCVADDGKGGIVEGFGIAGMRRRISDVGGTFDVQSGGTGTRMHASLQAAAS